VPFVVVAATLLIICRCAALGIEAEILLRVATAAEPLLPCPQKIAAESPTRT
jgi:hypothetical protein